MTITSRLCPKCGNRHNMVVQDRKTGEVLEIVDLCRDCLCSPKKQTDNTEKKTPWKFKDDNTIK